MSTGARPVNEQLTFIDVGAGQLALTHRPKYKDIRKWVGQVDTVVTLLLEREDGSQICSAVRYAGLDSIWVPFLATKPDTFEEARLGVTKITRLFDYGQRVVVHCSAGIHRTGMFGYALLRTCGWSPHNAVNGLYEMRPITRTCSDQFIGQAEAHLLTKGAQ